MVHCQPATAMLVLQIVHTLDRLEQTGHHGNLLPQQTRLNLPSCRYGGRGLAGRSAHARAQTCAN